MFPFCKDKIILLKINELIDYCLFVIHYFLCGNQLFILKDLLI